MGEKKNYFFYRVWMKDISSSGEWEQKLTHTTYLHQIIKTSDF